MVLAVAPGIMAFYKLVSPVQAGFLVMLAYVISRRHANEIHRQWERKEEEAAAKKKEEEERLLALPSKKRKNIVKGIAKRVEVGGEEKGSSDSGT